MAFQKDMRSGKRDKTFEKIRHTEEFWKDMTSRKSRTFEKIGGTEKFSKT